MMGDAPATLLRVVGFAAAVPVSCHDHAAFPFPARHNRVRKVLPCWGEDLAVGAVAVVNQGLVCAPPESAVPERGAPRPHGVGRAVPTSFTTRQPDMALLAFQPGTPAL